MDSSGTIIFAIIVVTVIAIVVVYLVQESRIEATLTPEQSAARREAKSKDWEERKARLQDGEVNPALICPHCQTKGQVRVKAIKHKAGISGSKATAAVLTGGISMLATGLSRKEVMTQANCSNCGSIWRF